jgi:LuxR family transcriptional regulator, maltose regulon positive regulatory protein
MPPSKVSRPRLSTVLPRPRLYRRLDVAARRPIVWIGAPAGAGKTTLAASYLAERGRPTLWYQVDGRDADAATFFYYLREGAKHVPDRRRGALPLLTPEYAFGLEAYARQFFEKLGASLPDGAWVVLDDYDDAPADSPLHAFLPKALAALPPHVRVLVLSRAAPPATFARLVAEDAIALVAPAELDLTLDETSALARTARYETSDASFAGDLRARTGGWVAATVLLLGSRTSSPPARHGGEWPGQQLLLDYLATEVFARAPPDAQRLLLATAPLPEVDPDAAEALSGDPRAGQLLADLVRGNYFTVRLAGAHPRYRLHPLFREFLLERARRTVDAPTRRRLSARAAELLVQAGDADAAADLLVDGAEWESLAELVRAHAPALARQGRLASLESWLCAIPEARVDADPWLTYWLAACLVTCPEEARVRFERAYRGFRNRGELPGTLSAWAGLVGTILLAWNTFQELDPWIAEMEELGPTLRSFPSVEVEAQITFGMLAGLMWRYGAHPQLAEWRDRATALLDSDAPADVRMRLAACLFFHWVSWRGDLAAGERVLAAVEPLALAPDATPLTQLLFSVLEAHGRARAGESVACLAAVERGLAIARSTGVRGLDHALAIQGVYGGLVAGDLAGARRHHDAARRDLGTERTNRAHFEQLGAWIALCAGDLDGAEPSARRALAHAEASGADLAVPWAEQTLAHVLIERGAHEEAVSRLERCIVWAHRVDDRAVLRHALLAIAYARLVQGRVAEALPFLADALGLGRERGDVRHFWIGWRRDVMARLAVLALEHDIEPEHVRAEVEALGLAPPQAARTLAAWPWPVRIFSLGPFELWGSAGRILFPGKVPRQPIRFVQALVALGGRDVPDDRISDALWPEAEGDAARRALEVTLHRARRMLGRSDAIVQRGRRLSFEPGVCWVDALALGDALDAPPAEPRSREAQAERVASLYRGPLLPGADEELPFVAPARERLRGRIARYLAPLLRGEAPSRDGEHWSARCGRRCAEADPALRW